MGILTKRVSTVDSEEVVLGVSEPWKGEGEQAGMESTTIAILSESSRRGWSGFAGASHKSPTAVIGEKLRGKEFPALCVVKWKRGVQEQSRVYDGRASVKDVDTLIPVDVIYKCPVDLVEKVAGKA